MKKLSIELSENDVGCYVNTNLRNINEEQTLEIKKLLNNQVNETELKKFYSDTSVDFNLGKNKKIGVKIVDSRGIESLIIKKIDG